MLLFGSQFSDSFTSVHGVIPDPRNHSRREYFCNIMNNTNKRWKSINKVVNNINKSRPEPEVLKFKATGKPQSRNRWQKTTKRRPVYTDSAKEN
jgi:hypothetical protein